VHLSGLVRAPQVLPAIEAIQRGDDDGVGMVSGGGADSASAAWAGAERSDALGKAAWGLGRPAPNGGAREQEGASAGSVDSVRDESAHLTTAPHSAAAHSARTADEATSNSTSPR